MDHAALFADLPQEIQYDILRYLEADRRLTFLQSSPAVQASQLALPPAVPALSVAVRTPFRLFSASIITDLPS